jgi:dimethylargininase
VTRASPQPASTPAADRADAAPNRALVRRPGPRLADGLVTHIGRSPVDADRALEQWLGYVAALEAAGWTVVEVPAADDCPDSVFVEDTMVVYDDLAVIARSGAPERRAEAHDAEATVASLGYRVERMQAPGTFDGGDVLKVGSCVYVGVGGRTNPAGLAALQQLLTPLGASVVGVPLSKVLHLKSAVTALPDGTVIGFPPLVDDVSAFPAFEPVPEEPGSHVVLLGEDRVLMAASAPRTAELLAERGISPVVVDISEFERLEGCVTCLSVRLRSSDRSS